MSPEEHSELLLRLGPSSKTKDGPFRSRMALLVSVYLRKAVQIVFTLEKTANKRPLGSPWRPGPRTDRSPLQRTGEAAQDSGKDRRGCSAAPAPAPQILS